MKRGRQVASFHFDGVNAWASRGRENDPAWDRPATEAV